MSYAGFGGSPTQAQGAILIVDDDVATQCLLSAIAGRNQLTPVVTGNGKAALELIARRDYDVILLDLFMPELNGFEVLRHISCVRPALLERIIILTAADEATYRECGYLHDVWALLRKPVDLSELEYQMLCCLAERKLTEPRRSAQRVPPMPRPRLLLRTPQR